MVTAFDIFSDDIHIMPSESDDKCIYSVLKSTFRHSSVFFDIYINMM